MRAPSLLLPFLLGLTASFIACDDDGVGAPCNDDADCKSGLICDEHDGQKSCQAEHGHGSDDDHDHETEGHETEGHETGEHETGEHDGHDSSGGSGHASESGEHGSETGEHGTSSGG